MRVAVRQMLTPEDLGEARCCACGKRFFRSVAEAYLLTDTGMDMGEICPSCLGRGAEHIEKHMEQNAYWARLNAEALGRAAAELVEDCPSLDEYLAMEQAIGQPRYASFEEADRAMGYID
jgi:hypothetical protein